MLNISHKTKQNITPIYVICSEYAFILIYIYSTVTDLARFLGLSTSQPLATAT